MPRYRVDPRTTRTVEMKDGTNYPVSRNGWLTVGHQHEREMSASPARSGNERDAALDPVRLITPRAAGWDCAACGTGAWPWQAACPRCGAPR